MFIGSLQTPANYRKRFRGTFVNAINVAINGYGTIGKRVADAVDAQEDMELSLIHI